MRNPTARFTGTINGQQGGGGTRGERPVLGIDVSKATLAVTLLDPQTRATRWEGEVPNTPIGIAHLLERVPLTDPWVMEPTGRYSTGVAAAAQAAGRVVLLAPPKQAKAFLRAIQDRAKTDRLDSRGLALYALAVPLKSYPVKSDVTEKIDQLLAARHLISSAISRMTQQKADLPHAADVLTTALEGLKRERARLDKQIAELTTEEEELADARVLDAIPGIGLITAAAVASCLQAKQFSHPDQFVAHLGLDVQVSDSGAHRGQRRLSKHGNAELRRLLYNCAQATRCARNSPFKAQYERERAKGLSPTAAACVICRKMARVCWSLHRHKTTYDPNRVYIQGGQPPHFRETA
jgi:transposase